MAELSIHLLGKQFNIICNDDEEEHIAKLVEYLKRRVHEVSIASRDSNPLYLMLLSSLLVCDDLFATRAEMEQMARQPDEQNKTDRITQEQLEVMAASLEATLSRLNALCKSRNID